MNNRGLIKMALKQCIKCGWIGEKGKLTTCCDCDDVYYKCPVCGGRMKIVQ